MHRRLLDRQQCVAGILPVDGHKAASSDDPPENRNLKILRLGNERQIPFLHDLPCKDRVKIGAVIAHQQEPAVLRQLLHAVNMNVDVQQPDTAGGRTVKQPAVEWAVMLVFLFGVHQQGTDRQKQDIQQAQPKQGRKNPQNDFSHCVRLPDTGSIDDLVVRIHRLELLHRSRLPVC